jgi:hypothetical protein
LKEAKVLLNLIERAFVRYLIVLTKQARAAEPLHMAPQVFEPLLIPRPEWRNESFHSGFGQSDLSLRCGKFPNQLAGRIDAMPAVDSQTYRTGVDNYGCIVGNCGGVAKCRPVIFVAEFSPAV